MRACPKDLGVRRCDGCPDNTPAYRLSFNHGLGDAVQATSLVAHLRHYHPERPVAVQCRPGQEGLFRAAGCVIGFEGPETHAVRWNEMGIRSFAATPSTKLEACLLDEFGLDPLPDLCRYRLEVPGGTIARAKRWLRDTLGPLGPIAFFQFLGASSRAKKDLTHDQALAICEALRAAGLRVLLYDPEHKASLPEASFARRVEFADLAAIAGTPAGQVPDAMGLAAILTACDRAIAIDSGPGLLAQALAGAGLGPPSLQIWIRHHPVHYGCPSAVTHLVPVDHRQFVHRPIDAALAFFRAHYRHRIYESLGAIAGEVEGWLRETPAGPAARLLAAIRDSAGPAARFGTRADPGLQQRILVSARHGLGDTVQLGIVLAHLAKHRPLWTVDVALLESKAGAVGPVAGTLHTAPSPAALDELLDALGPEHDAVYDLAWGEPTECWQDSPSTKAEKCLREVFEIAPDPELWRGYRVAVREPARAAAAAYLAEVCRGRPPRADGRFSALVLHYRGDSSKPEKDLEHEEAQWICRAIGRDYGLAPVVLDWRGECPFADPDAAGRASRPPSSFWPAGGDTAELLAALVEQSALAIAIDSGPGHVAGATTTPTILIWKDLHPLHYYHPLAHVTHFVPAHHAHALKGNAKQGLDFFTRNYPHRVYHSFLADLHGLAADVLGARGMMFQSNHWVRSATLNQDLEIVRDVYEEDCYRLKEWPLAREVIVDVGACLGSFARLAIERNPSARVIAVECCPENWEVLERNLAGIAEIEKSALTYEAGVALLNSVYPGCASTGGSTVVPWSRAVEYVAGGPQGRPGVVDEHGNKREYFADFRPLPTITLEALRAKYGLLGKTIDVLKLDCEGSEYSILEHADLSCVRMIVGEYHGEARWNEFHPRVFCAGWRYELMRGGDFGLFRASRT